MTPQQIILTVLCLALSIVVCAAASGLRPRSSVRPQFRTKLDMERFQNLMEGLKYPQAEAICRTLLKEYPSDHEAKCCLSAALAAQNKQDEACAVLLGLTQTRSQKDPWVYAQLGYLYAEMGMVSQSAQMLDRGLELFPRNTDLLSYRSRLYLDSGDGIRALGLAQEALTVNPQDLGARWAKMLALERLESWEEALQEAENICRDNPENVESVLQKAHIRMKQGEFDDALEICDRELMKSPRYSMIYRAKAGVLTRAGQYEQALNQLERARELGAEAEQIDLESLDALCGAGRKDEAYSLLDAIIRRNSPVTEHFLDDRAKEEYPVLTSQKDFQAFLEEKRNI